MIQSTVRWLRVTWPPWWTVALYLLCQAFHAWACYSYRLVLLVPEVAEALTNTRRVMAVMACAAYGFYRCWRFYPLWSASYRNWLETTPWTAGKPLPLGPPHLVAQDLVLLATVWALSFDLAWGHWLVPLSFLGPHLACVGVSLWIVGQTKTAWSMAFLAVAAGAVARWPEASLAVVALTIYPLAHLGLRRSLTRFPWTVERERLRDLSQATANANRSDRGKVMLGWSYELLAPKLPISPFSRSDRLLLGPLIGCVMVACALQAPKAEMARDPLLIAFLVTCMGCIVLRMGVYIGYYWPPIGPWGRIRLGLWIIPGYDKVFIAPLVVLAIYIVGGTLCDQTAAAPILVAPICAAGVILATLNVGPSLANWRLTGQHRIMGVQVENGMIGRV